MDSRKNIRSQLEQSIVSDQRETANKLLDEYGQEFVAENNHDGFVGKIIHLAVRKNYVEIVEKMLVLSTVDPKSLPAWFTHGEYGNTPLHVACRYGCKETLEVLLQKITQYPTELVQKMLNAVNNKKCTAVDLSIALYYFDKAWQLVRGGAEIDIQREILQGSDGPFDIYSQRLRLLAENGCLLGTLIGEDISAIPAAGLPELTEKYDIFLLGTTIEGKEIPEKCSMEDAVKKFLTLEKIEKNYILSRCEIVLAHKPHLKDVRNFFLACMAQLTLKETLIFHLEHSDSWWKKIPASSVDKLPIDLHPVLPRFLGRYQQG